jgi:CheY-like chemotaxis protein
MEEVAMVAQRLVERAGYTMDWLASSEAAWDYLQRGARRPDLVLLDIHLPGMSGVDLCRRLRATPDLAGLLVALFSQMDRPEAVAAARDAGANFVLSKELLSRPAIWQRHLHLILSRSRLSGAQSEATTVAPALPLAGSHA